MITTNEMVEWLETEEKQLDDRAILYKAGSPNHVILTDRSIMLGSVRDFMTAHSREGWHLVPIEPTEEMFKAFVGDDELDVDEFWGGYKAMIAASPQPPEDQS